MPVLNMPRLSDSMEEGTIVEWLADEGSAIELGQELVEIETDKATMTYESEFAGVLRRLAEEGETVAVGQPIAEVVTKEDVPTNVPPPVGAPPSLAASPVEGTGIGNGAASRDGDVSERPKATPLARRIAAGIGVDLATVEGTGPFGRIVAADVRAASLRLDQAAPLDTAPPAVPDPARETNGAGREVTREPLSRVQALIARRMAQAKSSMPEFTVSMDIDMDACVDLRARLQEAADDFPPSFNDMVIKACARALRRHPYVNGTYRDDGFEFHTHVNIGVAVAADRNLLVPTVRDADTKSLGTIAHEVAGLVTRARAGQLTPPELEGGTFTISNLGMFGVSNFTAVLNPPQAAILAVGAVEQRPGVRDGALVAAHRMTVTLTCDHRIVYGADAAAFLTDVRQELEQPLRLTL